MSATSEIYLSLTVTDLSRGGAGVARDSDGRVIFIPFTIPGDRVWVRLLEIKKQFAQAELIRLEILSPQRQVPRCPAFSRCGGCQWQHIPYELQWQTKLKGIQHALKRVQVNFTGAWDEFPAQQIWEYRNRIQLRGFQNKLGFYSPKSHQLVAVERCDIARKEINESWEKIRNLGTQYSKPYKVEVEVLPSGEIQHYWNQGHAASGFRQVHDEQNKKLRSWVIEVLSPGVELFDLFGGSGNFSKLAARKMTLVHCVDISAPQTTLGPTPPNLQFHRSPVLSWVLKQNEKKPRVAIMDPPRKGLQDDFPALSNQLEKLGVFELVAIGCDPDCWARDIHRFIDRGWNLEKVAVFDLFPQTSHVESAALLRYPNRKAKQEVS